MRILLVTQMWPTPAEPDLGSFLLPLRRELVALGHEVEVAAIGQRGGGEGQVRAADRRRGAAPRGASAPDVVFAHFLFPAGAAGLAAARAARVPLVVMAHGQDVANLDRAPLRLATRPVVRGAAAVIANSRWLADRLERALPRAGLRGLRPRRRPRAVRPRTRRAAALAGRRRRPALSLRRLADRAQERRRAGRRVRARSAAARWPSSATARCAPTLEGRAGVAVVGRVPHAEVPAWIAACDVLCQPSLAEPFGLAALEAMAMERTVVATTEGGPPEFVTPEAGVLVDPRDPPPCSPRCSGRPRCRRPIRPPGWPRPRTTPRARPAGWQRS